MIAQAIELGAGVLWLPVFVAVLAGTRAGRAIVERTRPWTVPGLEPKPAERCTCPEGVRCHHRALLEWRAEREENPC